MYSNSLTFPIGNVLIYFRYRLLLINGFAKTSVTSRYTGENRNESSFEFVIKTRVCIHFGDLNSELFGSNNIFGRLSSKLSPAMIIGAFERFNYRIFFIWNYYYCLILLIFGRFSMTVISIALHYNEIYEP